MTKTFDDARAKAIKAFTVIAKGIPKGMLNDDISKQAVDLSGRNGVQVHKAPLKYFSKESKYSAMLLEFTRMKNANQLYRYGLI